MKNLLPIAVAVFVCLIGCAKSKGIATAEEKHAGSEESAIAEEKAVVEKERKPIPASTLTKQDDRYLDPSTGEGYSGPVWYAENSFKFTGSLLKGWKDGLWISWDDAGRKSTEIHYKKGKKHGLQTWFYEDGTKDFETPYIEGKIHGLQTWYREDGTKKRECQYINNDKSGCKDF